MAANPLKVTEVCHVVPSLLYSVPEPTGEVTVIVPVTRAHVGSVIVATGAEGGRGMAFMTKFADETQVSWAVVRALIVYVVLGDNPLNVVVVCQFVPSLLYSVVEPDGEVTTIEPVVTLQVG